MNSKKREIIFTIAGVLILTALLIVIFFTITFAKNIFQSIEGQNNLASPVARFNFEKLKNIGIIKE
ncbi:MAG: hypothetical protein NUV83_01455 [Candidatus Wolfebacteria bacterium]|nr:hypothetical protein [Candidatus Wolfebacteria bacterium]